MLRRISVVQKQWSFNVKLSIVTTLYKSAPYIQAFYSRITKTASLITDDYEIIFVDDGSPDNSIKLAQNLILKDDRIKIIELSRNFGHHKAMATGLKYAEGEYIFLIDSDLEEDPELLKQFWDELHKDDDTDVIYGIQEARKGHWFERWSGDIYYKVLNGISDEVKTAKNISTVRLMKKNYVKALSEYQEHGFYFGPISILVGFNQKGCLFKKNSKAESSYHFFKKYHIFLDSIISFSSKPLYFIFYFGTCVTFFSFFYMIYLIFRKMLWGIAIEGWTSLIVLTSLLGGLNIFFVGIMAVYILHIFQETKNRPFSLVRKIYSNKSRVHTQIVKDNTPSEFREIDTICQLSSGENQS